MNMYFLSIYLFVPMINAFIITRIHRNAVYRPLSSCAFIDNTTLLNDASSQSCTWECVHDYNCQTAVYFHDKRVCSMFSELCEKGSIESSGDVSASVICYRKNHEPIVTCSSTATTNQEAEEKTLDSSTMTTTEQTLTSITSTMITTLTSFTTTAATSTTITTENPYACGNMTVLIGYDLYGSDITYGIRDNYTLCCEWCQSSNGCVAYTWILSTAGWAASNCFIKHTIPSFSINAALVSAHY